MITGNDDPAFRQDSEKPILVTNFHLLKLLSSLIGLATILFILWVLINPLGEVYVQFHLLILAIMGPYLLAIILCAAIILRGSLLLYNDRVVRKPFWGNPYTLYFTDLEGWCPNYSSFGLKTITLLFHNQSITVWPTDNLNIFYSHLNYWGLKPMRPVPPVPGNNAQRNTLLVLFACSLPPGILLSVIITNIMNHQKGDKLATISHVVLSKRPMMYEAERNHMHEHYETYFKIKGFDNLSFASFNDTVFLYYQNFPESDLQDDTISIGILKYDYDVRIAQTQRPSFWDKHFDWDEIHIKTIRLDSMHDEYYLVTTDPNWGTGLRSSWLDRLTATKIND